MGGVGNFIGSLFGISQPKTPSVPEYTPQPVREAEIEAEAKGVRDDERRKLRQRRAMSGTVLTSPLGVGSGSGTGGGVLGASFAGKDEG